MVLSIPFIYPPKINNSIGTHHTGFHPELLTFLPVFYQYYQSILEFFCDVLYFNYEMRFNKNQIEHMAFVIVRNLIQDEKIILEDKIKLYEETINLITEEFQKEDKLDQEVREILTKHIEIIRKDNIEYQTMFRMIKTKLAKERDLVL